MAKRKYYYYVGVITSNGITLVTDIDNETRRAHWNLDEKPKEFGSKTYAQDLATGLICNFIPAVLITSLVELKGQPCNQNRTETKEEK